LGVIFFAGAWGDSKPYRARQKSVTPNPHEEPCAPDGLKVRSTFESFSGSLCSQREQFLPVANDGLQTTTKAERAKRS
jgi:hypothetical protein